MRQKWIEKNVFSEARKDFQRSKDAGSNVEQAKNLADTLITTYTKKNDGNNREFIQLEIEQAFYETYGQPLYTDNERAQLYDATMRNTQHNEEDLKKRIDQAKQDAAQAVEQHRQNNLIMLLSELKSDLQYLKSK
ncbi:hypothetical protein KC711_00310 [Candidatus Peregrinibacteria bacterium]|nr:hypothetical protein [Candidatus Peregrinibacteria bacterium]MCB9804699.1 hypothetical protein [Candidatus Peribacteria bacterium]